MSRESIQIVFFILLTIIFNACGTVKSPYYSAETMNWENENQDIQNKQIHALYLVGNSSKLDDTLQNKNIVLDAIGKSIANEKSISSLVFLGDNIEPRGLPKKDNPKRKSAERILNNQIDLAQTHDGITYFIPGNRDWNDHDKGGRKAILRQEEYIKSERKNKNIKFYPKNACGDPEVVKIHKDLVFVFLDSQWWLQDWRQEKKMNHKCDIKSRGDLLKRIEEIIADHKNDEIIFMMHHDMKSNGNHGGKFNLKQHLFPLTDVNSKLWIPLPIIGSLYPIFHNVSGTKQDIANESHKQLMEGIYAAANKWKVNIVFASGHEHGLQYFDHDKIKYIVSGGGSMSSHIAQGGGASYARSARGFVKITFHKNNEAWLEIYKVNDFDDSPTLEFRIRMRAPRKGTVEEKIEYPPVSELTHTTAASEIFGAGPIKKLFLGDQYRDIWSTPVKAEVIDLESKLGGLTPIKKGGGMASNSLRMERENGQQYILRSIKKDYTKLVPEEFENLKLIDVIADQNSASHPYNALAIPTLSKAAGVYYTTPKLVYLKHQRGLGNYNSQFNEELYLLEERPSDDWSNAAQFGNSSEIIGYADLLDILVSKKNHFVDQKWVLRSRIFDLFIHDWDRHDDQWRWAKFDIDGKNIYRPIPRDRDQAFYKFRGIIPWYISAFVMKKFKTMKGDVKDVKNLSFNAKHFDRHFLNELEWSEWEPIIKALQKDITDETIDESMLQFPPEIIPLKDTPQLAKLLKERKSNLMKMGRKLYDFLSKEVEIVGTDKKDNFEIVQHENGDLTVRHFIDNKGKKDLLKYERTFYPNQTKEVRIYGLREKDDFIITGESNNKIKLRIIGGEDNDDIKNETQSRKVFAYDYLKGMDIKGNAIIDKRSNTIEINEYDRSAFKYNTSFPILTFGSTVDDGFWFGGAINWTTHSWRKDPYQSKHSLSLSIAPGSQDAVQLNYKGDFTDVMGKLNFSPEININFPEYENFFGFGGNTTNPLRRRQYHWVRMKNVDINPLFSFHSGKYSLIEFGPVYQYRDIELTSMRITEDRPNFFTQEALDYRSYYGGKINYKLSFVDGGSFPTNGFSFSASASHVIEPVREESVTLVNVNTQAYIQLLTRPKLVLATNTGLMLSSGDRQFYHYPDLGNNNGLRGYRNERFRGTTALYNNLDLRIKLINWNNNVLPMDVGLTAGYDIGKVYFDDQKKNPWHSSQTIGIWFDVLGALIIQPYYSINEEQNTFTLQVGFSF